MTVVEFFDKSPINNVVSSLSLHPDKIIFLGSGKAMKRFDKPLQDILQSRGIHAQTEYRSLPLSNLNRLVAELSQIVETEEPCVFDLTGGTELPLVAMGIVFAKYPDKAINLQRINVNNGTVTDCDGDGKLLYIAPPELSVEEMIRIHGGAIRYESGGEFRTYPWELNREFVADIHKLWDICREEPAKWNAQLKLLGELCADMDPDSLEVQIPMDVVEARSWDRFLESLLDALYRKDLIRCYGCSSEFLSYEYKDAQIKKVLEKAGTTLELQVLATAAELLDEDGNTFFTDVLSGVFIDWDGDFHSTWDVEKDTENEIDVILTKGVTPVFISCKNGKVDDEELYKLNTVAERFGGKHAKKVLIATYLGKTPHSLQYFRKRCKDMNIRFIEDAHLLSSEEFAQALCRTVKP